MSFRIAFGGIHIESTTYTKYVSSKKDFRIRKGEELLDYYPWLNKYDEVVCIPLIHARAIPGGKVSNDFFVEWKTNFLQMIKDIVSVKSIDGILFDIHGAMSVEGMIDAEGILAEELREIVGKDVIISAAMDLHGNVSDKLFNNCDMLTCYRTAPHIDVDETFERAFLNMIKVLNFDCDVKVYKSKIDVPILLPGEKTSTEVEPGKSLYRKLGILCQNESIIDASIWMGFPWADENRNHSVVIVTGTNKKEVEKSVKKIAIDLWDNRKKFNFVGPVDSIENAIKTAIDFNDKPFFISDTGDNPGAGGSGDLNIILKQYIDLKNNNIKKTKKILFASIFDKKAIQKIYSEKKEKQIQLQLGGNTDKKYGKPLNLFVDVVSYFEDTIAGRGAVIKIDNIFVIITENRYQYGTLKSFNKTGIKTFSEFDIIVVKMGYLEPDLKAAAAGWVMALSPGAVSQDLINIKYNSRMKPLYPFENFKFKPKIKIKELHKF